METTQGRYAPRLAERALERKLASSGCVLIRGPKFCGKTTLARKYARSERSLISESIIERTKADPASALGGERPRLIDEWQKVPELWDLIRADIDREPSFGKFIITGSTTPVDPRRIQHSGAGRISQIVLRPFSLWESGDSSGIVSLRALFEDASAPMPCLDEGEGTTLERLAFLMARGGWPLSATAPDSVSLDVTRNYFEGLFVLAGEEDEFSPFLERRDPRLLLAVLKELARNISSEAGLQTMASSLRSSGDWPSLDVDTFARYKKILEDLFLVYDMPSWNKNLRSTVVTRRAPVRHFFDPSIAIASLGAAPADLLSDIRSFGLFYEDLAVRDLAVYADCLGASLKHYRDSSGLEVDAIVELRNGRYGAIEVKVASPENVEKAASSLLRFERRMDEIGSERPSFRMVLTTNGACYRRADGTYVVPITCLRD